MRRLDDVGDLLRELGLESVGELEWLIADRCGALFAEVRIGSRGLDVAVAGQPPGSAQFPIFAHEVWECLTPCVVGCPACGELMRDAFCRTCATVRCPLCGGSAAGGEPPECPHATVVGLAEDVVTDSRLAWSHDPLALIASSGAEAGAITLIGAVETVGLLGASTIVAVFSDHPARFWSSIQRHRAAGAPR